MKPILNNVPLTEKDIHDDHASFFMAKKGVLLKDVQAAKRLLIGKMTSSNALKCVVSDYETTTNEDVFEYSVFGSPQQKIGDFTQTKIGGFS